MYNSQVLTHTNHSLISISMDISNLIFQTFQLTQCVIHKCNQLQQQPPQPQQPTSQQQQPKELEVQRVSNRPIPYQQTSNPPSPKAGSQQYTTSLSHFLASSSQSSPAGWGCQQLGVKQEGLSLAMLSGAGKGFQREIMSLFLQEGEVNPQTTFSLHKAGHHHMLDLDLIIIMTCRENTTSTETDIMHQDLQIEGLICQTFSHRVVLNTSMRKDQ